MPDVIYATPGQRSRRKTGRWLRAPAPGGFTTLGSRPELAEMLPAGERENLYELFAWVIMPNHVHILILPISGPQKIMHWIKGRSAKESNSLLGRTGPFWQHESYDHFVRSRKEFDRVVSYIEQNPVSAGFVCKAEDWRFSSASFWTS